MATKKSMANKKRRLARAKSARLGQGTSPQAPAPYAYHNIFATPDGKVIKFEPLSGASWILLGEGWLSIPTVTRPTTITLQK